MTQGRQSKRGKIALGLISALLCVAALAPATAPAAGDCEYCVNIPNGDGGAQDPTAHTSGGSDGSSDSSGTAATGTATTTTTDTATTVESSDDDSDKSGGGGAGGGGKGGDGDNGSAAKGDQNSVAATNEPATASSDSDDGGFPLILVALAVLAAAGVGYAAWRFRRDDGMGTPAETGHRA
jgi:cobalamin biosynthesis Mg chelatase CobN